MKRTAVLTAPCLALLIVSCSGSPTSPGEPADISPSQVESLLTNLINQARSQEGISPLLSTDAAVAQVARRHSEAMRDRGFFSHVDPEGKRLRDRLRAAGITFRSAGENLAQVDGSSDPAGQAHQMLMGSQSHRDNILSEEFELIGVGVAKQGSTYWITQIFVEP